MSGLAIAARIAEVWGPEDDVVRARLDFQVKVLGLCRYCGRQLTDASLMKSPGVCRRPKCIRQAKREAKMARKKAAVPVPLSPAQKAWVTRRARAADAAKALDPDGKSLAAPETAAPKKKAPP